MVAFCSLNAGSIHSPIQFDPRFDLVCSNLVGVIYRVHLG